jgi:hypothetical protein
MKNKNQNKKNPSKWVEEKEAKFESVREDFENRKHEKGFRLIVKDIETGSIIINEAIDVLVGGWAKKNGKGVQGAGTIVSSCDLATLVSAIDSAEQTIEKAKDSAIKEALGDQELASEMLSQIVKGVLGGKKHE